MAFKMKGFPMQKTTAVKHTRRREGHMETYGAGHTNADHPDYWKKDETGVTPKSKEVAADKEAKGTTTDKKSKTASTDKSKKKIGEKVVGELKSKFQAWKEGQKKRVAAGPKPKPGDKKYKWSPSGGWKAGGKEKYEADLAAYNEKLKKSPVKDFSQNAYHSLGDSYNPDAHPHQERERGPDGLVKTGAKVKKKKRKE
jgi:hypothetical protein